MLEQYISKENNYETLFLIGSNGTGKTYNLLNIYEKDTTKNIYVSEDGEIHNRTHKNKVKLELDKKLYIFESDEKQRGNRQVDNTSKQVNINPKLLDLLNFCCKELNNIRKIKKKSRGQTKILNILEIITSIFLNSVSVILFDEPENYLDDNYLRIIARLFALLKKAKIKVIVATHNPRLCELCNMTIDNAILMDIKNVNGKVEYTEANLTMQDAKEVYINVSNEIKDIANKNKYNEDSGILKKLNMSENDLLFDDLLKYLLQSEEFYRALFYKDILVVEGETEKTILKKIYKNILESSHFFAVNGKAFLPFFVEIFIRFNKNVKILFDSDKKPDKNYNTAVAITDYFESKYTDICKIFEYDLESHFGIDLESFRKNNGFSQRDKFMIKQFAAEEYFKNENNLKKFINFIN